MKYLLFFLVDLAISRSLFSQREIPEFGKIDIADLKLQSCPFEPGASAMKLFDVQEIEFDPFGYTIKLTTERRVRIKIFNPQGYKYATFRIPYSTKKSVMKIKDLSAVVYSLDSHGQIKTENLENEDFLKEKNKDNIGIINFTFPNLKPGSVVEFRFKKLEKDVIQLDPWTLQDEIPTAYTSTILTIPTDFNVKTKLYGTDTVYETTKTGEKGRYAIEKRTYYKENIASFQSEPFMSSFNDNLQKMVFLLLPKRFLFSIPDVAWRFFGHILLISQSFGDQLKKTIPGTEAIIDSAKKISDFEKRVGFIYEAVKKRMTGKGEQTMYANNILEAWDDKAGNTADINIILINLLQKAGINCFPLLISTRDHGKINKDFPSFGQLNGVDVLAKDTSNNRFLLMDASLKYQSHLNPPFNVLNREGYLLEENNMQWVNIIDSRQLMKENINISASINSNGKIQGSAFCIYYDYAKSYMLDSSAKEEKENKYLDKTPLGLKIDSIKYENLEDNHEPLVQKIYFTCEPQNSNNFYFINPQILSSPKENPFIKQIRNTDIDFGCNQRHTLVLELEIPDSFEVDHLPGNIIVRAPDSSFFYKRIYTSDSVHIHLSQTFEIDQPIFNKEDYKSVQEFFEKAYHLMSEEIILRKRK